MAISNDVKIGKTTKVYHPNLVNFYGCTIGENCKIGAFVEIQNGVHIGNFVKIQAHAFIPEGVTIEDEAFIGPHVVFTNDRFPHATNENGMLQEKSEWKVIKTRVEKGASIGANATILCGITIGENALVGAGSMVTKDVPANTIVVGNPARILRKN